MAVPERMAFSPDGSMLTFLRRVADGSGLSGLYGLDMKTLDTRPVLLPSSNADTEATLSLEEKLRRERQRRLSVGITEYWWFPTGAPRLLVPQQGNLYIHDAPMDADSASRELRIVFDKGSTGCKGPAIDPKISPDGNMLSFVQDGEVYVMPADGSAPAKQVTFGARGTGKTNGLADFIAQEEMDRYTGYWWAPDSTKIAFQEVDESHIPEYRIMHQARAEVTWENHRYPFAGAANPKVRLGVVDVSVEATADSFAPQWLDLGDEAEYLARVDWLANSTLTVQVQNRNQTTLKLLQFDAATGAGGVLLTEETDVWIQLNNLFTALPLDFVPPGSSTSESKGEEGQDSAVHFLWGSERTGFACLYLYAAPTTPGAAARLVTQVTSGEFNVEAVDHVDTASGKVFITGAPGGRAALGRYGYVTSLSGDDELTPVTVLEGTHTVLLNSSSTRCVDNWSALDTPATLQLLDVSSVGKEGGKAGVLKDVYHAPPATFKLLEDLDTSNAAAAAAAGAGAGAGAGTTAAASKPLPCLAPEIVAVTTRDGSETLYGALWKPDEAKHGPGPYPTIISVYGGPGVQVVRDMYRTTSAARAQRFREQGFLVFQVDNRGSSRRGIKFAAPLKHKMGTIEVDDQVDGVNYLVERGLADAARVGIYGWSYGGYMTLMSLCKASDVFKAGVSGAPVTYWEAYDTHYTERYMGRPQDNPDGYREANVIEHVGGMRGELMLIHGLIDENVHFRHTARLIHSLIKARKRYELFLLPDERHGPRSPADRAYVEMCVEGFFKRTLSLGAAAAATTATTAAANL